MSAVINTNIAAIRTHNVYNRNDTQMNAALSRVATGMKINSAKDGASTWAISEKMRERIRANDQANQNVQNDIALLKTAQGGVGNTLDILKTLKERALNAANDSNMNVDRSAIAAEVQQLIAQIDDNAAKVKFNGRTLLDGNAAKDTAATLPTNPVSSTEATEETEETEEVGGIKEPTAAENPEKTASHAVYGFDLSKLGSSVTSATKLVDLKDENGDALFEKGDIITLSWKEGDETDAVTKSIILDENTDFTAFNTTESQVKLNYFAKDDVLTDGAGTPNNVKSGGADYKAGANGIYAIGDKGVAITDFTVSVTNADEDETRVAAQEALAFTGELQGTTDGSHTVYKLATGLKAGSSSDASSSTVLTNLADDGGNSLSLAANDVISVKIGDTTATYKIVTGAKIEDLVKDINKQLKDTGVSLVYNSDSSALKNGNQTVKNAGGEEVNATTKGFYLIGAKNTELAAEDVKFSYLVGGTTDTAAKATSLFGVPAATNATTGAVVGQPFVTPDTPATNQLVQAAYVPPEEETEPETEPVTGSTLQFYVGGESNFGINVTIGTMTSEALKVNGLESSMLDKDSATAAIKTIDTAIQTVLNEQTNLGSVENRLGYASDNLITMNENLEAADSAMRDSDIAKEMTQYLKYSVLAQASQYMLAQSSQNAFSVLNLLQA